MRKNVCVIGAGPSGLVATKELLGEKHSATCFEHSAGPGGMFRAGISFDLKPGVTREQAARQNTMFYKTMKTLRLK